MTSDAPPLVERDAELTALGDHLQQAALGRGRLVLVAGEAGVGKTALLGRFLRGLPADVPGLTGFCDPLETPRALGPVLDIAAHLGPEVRRHLQTGRREDVFAALLDDLRGRPGPAVVALEDVHWADATTLDLLRFLASRIGSTRSLVVVTYRDDELGPGHPLVAVLGDLSRREAVARIQLRCLAPEGVEALARGRHPEPRRLHEITGGNPFFVTEVLAAGPGRLPETVRDAVRGRVARLSPAARATLEAAAVLGQPAAPALLRELSGAGFEALDECLGAGILQPLDEACAFRHELARMTVLETIPAGRRTELHSRVLAALAAGPTASDPSVLAHHAARSGDAAALQRYGPEAAARAAQLGAHREAAGHLSAILRGCEVAPDERARVLQRLAHHRFLAGAWSEAVAACEERLGMLREVGDPLGEAAVLAVLSRIQVLRGRTALAADAARRAVQLLETRPEGADLARATSELAQLRSLTGATAEALDLAERACAMAERTGATDALAVGRFVVGGIRINVDEEPARPLLLESLELARAAGRDDVAATVHLVLQANAAIRRRLDEADRWFERGLAYVAERDLPFGRTAIASARCLTLLHRGAWPEAAALAAETRGVRVPFLRVLANVVLGTIAARTGEGDPWVHLDAALADLDSAGLVRATAVCAARAEAAFLERDAARAAEEAGRGLAAAGLWGNPWLVGELEHWRAASGTAGPAMVAGGVAEPYAVQRAGRWREAAGRWRELGCPYEEARCLLDSDSEADLRSAFEAFDQLGARAACRLVADRLRSRGAASLPRGRRLGTRGTPLGLTTRQWEVLELVAAGLTDAEIGARLHLSTRTVSHHVSAILGSLGVRTRQAAAAAYRTAPPVELGTG